MKLTVKIPFDFEGYWAAKAAADKVELQAANALLQSSGEEIATLREQILEQAKVIAAGEVAYGQAGYELAQTKDKLASREYAIKQLKAGLQQAAESTDVETIEDPLRRRYAADGTISHIYIVGFATTYHLPGGRVITVQERD